MKINWLWDSRLSEKKVSKILRNERHPRFEFYAEKLLSRVSNPPEVFGFIDKTAFCKKWPAVKRRLEKDRWLVDKVLFWQVIYERVHRELKERGIKIRVPQKERIPLQRMKLARDIRDIRKKRGYTQKDLAKKLGVIQQYVSKIENGYENLSIDALERIVNVLQKKLVLSFE